MCALAQSARSLARSAASGGFRKACWSLNGNQQGGGWKKRACLPSRKQRVHLTSTSGQKEKASSELAKDRCSCCIPRGRLVLSFAHGLFGVKRTDVCWRRELTAHKHRVRDRVNNGLSLKNKKKGNHSKSHTQSNFQRPAGTVNGSEWGGGHGSHESRNALSCKWQTKKRVEDKRRSEL